MDNRTHTAIVIAVVVLCIGIGVLGFIVFLQNNSDSSNGGVDQKEEHLSEEQLSELNEDTRQAQLAYRQQDLDGCLEVPNDTKAALCLISVVKDVDDPDLCGRAKELSNIEYRYEGQTASLGADDYCRVRYADEKQHADVCDDIQHSSGLRQYCQQNIATGDRVSGDEYFNAILSGDPQQCTQMSERTTALDCLVEQAIRASDSTACKEADGLGENLVSLVVGGDTREVYPRNACLARYVKRTQDSAACQYFTDEADMRSLTQGVCES